MALGCKKRSACGRRRQKRNPRREESDTKEEGMPTTTTINFHMCEVPDAADPAPTQPGTTPSSPEDGRMPTILRILRTQKDVSFLSRKGCPFRIIEILQRYIF